MLRSIWEDLKREFNYGNAVTRIILVNVAVFVGINLVNIGLYLFNGWKADSTAFKQFLDYFCMSSDWKFVLFHPWVIITNMFSHYSFSHILWNMIFYHMCGRIVGDLLGNKRVLPIYLMGGIAGAAMFFITENLLNGGPFAGGPSTALGASAAVMATVVISGVIAPDYVIRLLLIGDVKLKYIVFTLIFLDLTFIAVGDSNSGGLFAHIGGDVFGFMYAWQLRKGNDFAFPFIRFFDWWDGAWSRWRTGKAPQRGPKVAYKNPKVREKTTAGRHDSNKRSTSAPPRYDNMSHQEQLDAILDKIKQHGYESLSTEEKEFLFNASKK
ncbi:MAG TPA: rhomboid family intramembrane serine protease [Haliscomenobacter sp.]|uniref:rhomboid family intramembrane serine protease n=1 Tax=Haliscomenobacter sp. TaxID=2717303 RepID=UPI002C782B2E|nr:rhomboid family intramembrane serine protease [Haliscomenobacter sp.]HOY18968.1 rhomboid family intramembrane serine protease [Haliscomenobacter sp.]